MGDIIFHIHNQSSYSVVIHKLRFLVTKTTGSDSKLLNNKRIRIQDKTSNAAYLR
jgi:archaellin